MARMVSAARLLFTGCYLALWPVLILALAGDWRWVAGWIFNVWFLSVCVTTVAWLFVKDPALLAERFRRPGTGGQSRGDAWIVFALAIGFIVWIAAVLMFVGAPLLTGSAVALITGALLTLLLAIRIANEERLLTIDLRGYEEYRHRVRYRLVPFIW